MTVSEFLGVDRNRVQGQADGVLAPTRLFNLISDRRGGYTPFGRRVEKGNTVDFFNDTSQPYMGFLGQDQSGLMTIVGGVGSIQFDLWHGDTFSSSLDGFFPGNFNDAAHLDLAGGYIQRDNFYVLDRDGEPVEAPLYINILASSETEDANEATGAVGASRIRAIVHDGPVGDKKWMLVNEAGEIYESADGAEWTLLYTATSGLNGIAYGNGAWVAVGTVDPVEDYNPGSNPAIIVTCQNADTTVWSDVTPVGALYFRDVSFAAGSFFASGREIQKSSDGTTWAMADDTHEGLSDNFDTRRIVASGDFLFAPVYNKNAIGVGDTRTYESVDAGGTWAQGQISGCRKRIVDVDVDGNGLFAMVAETGDIWKKDGATGGESKLAEDINRGSISSVGDMLGNTSDTPLTVIRFNQVTNSWFVAGRAGNVLESENLVSWTPVDDAEGFEGDIYAMGVNQETGAVIFGGDDGEIVAGGSQLGLAEGAYEVVALSYLNTRAGKIVFDITSQELSVVGRGGRISVTASTKERLVKDTLEQWVDDLAALDNPAYAEEQALLESIVPKVKVDVYLKYNPNAVGNTEEAEETYDEIVNAPVTVYDFTAPLGSGATDANTEIGLIEDEPLGAELGGGAGVTTTIYAHPQTATHGGRVWGMASQDQTKYHDDGVNLEIANVFGDYVLCYTEPGWANLIRPDNYLPLHPSQSSNFTGILSTPAGLMVFFDNEIFVVNGDAALGTLDYELYPDVVGNDVDAHPCLMGGVPFCVWQGRIYALIGGRAEDISAKVYRQDDKFIQVVPEPQSDSLIALTEQGNVYRYHYPAQEWFDNVVSHDGEFAIVHLMPHCDDATGDNTIYMRIGDFDRIHMEVARRDETPDAPSITYRGIDFGNPRLRHAVHRAMVPIEGLESFTDRSDTTTWEGSASGAGLVLGASPSGAFSDEQAGYQFTANEAITISGLMAAAEAGQTETVRLWDVTTGTALATVEVVGTDGSFVEVAITPITLEAGKSYGVSAVRIPQVSRVLISHSGTTLNAAMTLEGRYLFAGTSFPTVEVGDIYSLADVSLQGAVGEEQNCPRLYYSRQGETDVDDDETDGNTDFVYAVRKEELFTFRLPLGKKSRYIDLRFELRGMDYEDVVTPSLELIYSEGSAVR